MKRGGSVHNYIGFLHDKYKMSQTIICNYCYVFMDRQNVTHAIYNGLCIGNI